jgi:hypothetical protein
VVAAFGIGAATLAMANVVDPTATNQPATPSAVAFTPTASATRAAGDRQPSDDALGSYAYTPQQYAGELE